MAKRCGNNSLPIVSISGLHARRRTQRLSTTYRLSATLNKRKIMNVRRRAAGCGSINSVLYWRSPDDIYKTWSGVLESLFCFGLFFLSGRFDRPAAAQLGAPGGGCRIGADLRFDLRQEIGVPLQEFFGVLAPLTQARISE